MLKFVPYPAKAKQYDVDSVGLNYTKPDEVRALLHLADHTQRGIVEIGANAGSTTRHLAKQFPSRVIYGVDHLLPKVAHQQRGEVPKAAEFCHLTNGMRNVVPIHCDGAALNYDCLREVDFVFIDGDHSYHGVKGDTERAMTHLLRHGGGMIVWHDCYEGAPAWCGVWKYLDLLTGRGAKICVIKGTWLAYTFVEGNV